MVFPVCQPEYGNKVTVDPVLFFSMIEELFVAGKTPGHWLRIIERNFDASAQFTNFFVAVTVERTV
jgi:hypothetical protein